MHITYLFTSSRLDFFLVCLFANLSLKIEVILLLEPLLHNEYFELFQYCSFKSKILLLNYFFCCFLGVRVLTTFDSVP